MAQEIVDKYKMAPDSKVLINEISNSLRSELSHHSADISRLKNVMLKNEVIEKDDI